MARIAIIALLLFQVSFALHLDDHAASSSPAECAACIHFEEHDDAIAVTPAGIFEVPATIVATPATATFAPARTTLAYASRAPPRL